MHLTEKWLGFWRSFHGHFLVHWKMHLSSKMRNASGRWNLGFTVCGLFREKSIWQTSEEPPSGSMYDIIVTFYSHFMVLSVLDSSNYKFESFEKIVACLKIYKIIPLIEQFTISGSALTEMVSKRLSQFLAKMISKKHRIREEAFENLPSCSELRRHCDVWVFETCIIFSFRHQNSAWILSTVEHFLS